MAHRTTKSIVYGRTWARTLMAALAAAPLAELIDTGLVRLSKDPAFSLTPATVVADLEAGEADYTGYTPGGIAFTVGVPVNLGPTRVGIQTPVSFTMGTANPLVGNTVYGWWLEDANNFVCGEVFSSLDQVLFAAQGDFLQLDVVLPFALQIANDPV